MTRELTGRHVLIVLLSMFGVVFAVNGLFAYLALDGFPGLVTEDPYRKGLAFNKQIARSRALDELGWKLVVGAPAEGRLTMRFTDRDGRALPVSDIAVKLLHPTQANGDRVPKSERLQTGVYRIRLTDVPRGQWQMRITARGPGDRPLSFRRKLRLE